MKIAKDEKETKNHNIVITFFHNHFFRFVRLSARRCVFFIRLLCNGYAGDGDETNGIRERWQRWGEAAEKKSSKNEWKKTAKMSVEMCELQWELERWFCAQFRVRCCCSTLILYSFNAEYTRRRDGKNGQMEWNKSNRWANKREWWNIDINYDLLLHPIFFLSAVLLLEPLYCSVVLCSLFLFFFFIITY